MNTFSFDVLRYHWSEKVWEKVEKEVEMFVSCQCDSGVHLVNALNVDDKPIENIATCCNIFSILLVCLHC